MANKVCINRLQKEYRTLLKEPVPHITAHPTPNNLLEWHFVLEGAVGTEFEHGLYHGKVTFPPSYPYKPPSISLFTPNGRFSTNTKLCLSMTDYHPESWNPMWSVGTILTGLLSFMYDTQQTTGSIITPKAERVAFATASLAFNVKNPTFRKLFPEWTTQHTDSLAAAAAAAAEAAAAAATTSGAAQQGMPGGASGAAQGGLPHRGGQPGAAAGATGRGAAPGNQAGGGGWGSVGAFLFSAVVVVLILAVAVVPLISSRQGGAA